MGLVTQIEPLLDLLLEIRNANNWGRSLGETKMCICLGMYIGWKYDIQIFIRLRNPGKEHVFPHVKKVQQQAVPVQYASTLACRLHERHQAKHRCGTARERTTPSAGAWACRHVWLWAGEMAPAASFLRRVVVAAVEGHISAIKDEIDELGGRWWPLRR